MSPSQIISHLLKGMVIVAFVVLAFLFVRYAYRHGQEINQKEFSRRYTVNPTLF